MRVPAKLAVGTGLAAAVVTTGLATPYGARLYAGGEGPDHPRAVGAAMGRADRASLGQAEREVATAAVRERTELRAFGDPARMTVDSIVPWQGDDGVLAGAALRVRFPEPVSGTFQFFALPAQSPPGVAAGAPVAHTLRVRDMAAVDVRVDLRSRRIVEVSPADGTVIDGAEQAPAIREPDERGRD